MSTKISPRGSTTAPNASPSGGAAAVAGPSDKVASRTDSYLQNHAQSDIAMVEASLSARGWGCGLHSPRLHSPGRLKDPLQEIHNLLAGEARKQEERHKEVMEALRARSQSAFPPKQGGAPRDHAGPPGRPDHAAPSAITEDHQGVFHDEPPVRKRQNARSVGLDVEPLPVGEGLVLRQVSPASVWLAAATSEPEPLFANQDSDGQVAPPSARDEGSWQRAQDGTAFRFLSPTAPQGILRKDLKNMQPPSESHTSRSKAIDFEEAMSSAPAESPGSFLGETRYSLEMTASDVLRIVRVAPSMASYSSRFSTAFIEAHHEHHHHHHVPFYVMHPDSYFRFVLDTSSLLMLLMDSVLVPYQVAWDVSWEGAWLYLTWVTSVYWTLDMFLGFVAGYYDRGELHLRLGDICRHYLRGTFVPNVCATICDLVAILLVYLADDLQDSGALGVGKLPRLIKLHRVIRLVAILRTGKAARLYDRVAAKFEEVGFGTGFRATVQVVNITFLLMWMNHLGACIWHVFAYQATSTWYLEMDLAEDALSLFDYLLAYCWSTSALLAGESIMTPSNSQELVIAIVFILFGLITSSIIIGYISDTLIDFRVSNKDRMNQISALRKYMKQSRVPFSLASSLEREALEVHRTNKRLVEEDVNLLKNISPAGREKLNALVFGKVVCHDRFLRACHGLSRGMIKDICTKAISHVLVHPGFMAFEFDTQAEGAYLVHWGRYDYVTPSGSRQGSSVPLSAANSQQPEASYPMFSSHVATRNSGSSLRSASESDVGSTPCATGPIFGREAVVHERTSPRDSSRPQPVNDAMSEQDSVAEVAVASGRPVNHQMVEECQWFCQLALFYHMRHIGSMRAIAIGEHLILHGERLHGVLKTDARLALLARDYSKAIVDSIERRYDKREINELYLPMPHESILPLMPEATRALMSQAALDKLPDIWTGARARQELTAEVNSGQCDLVVDTKLRSWNQPLAETVLRVVSVVVLRLERADGMVLCQLGKLEHGECKVSLRLPGIKVGHGELPSDGLRRLMAEMVEPLKNGIQLGEKKVREEVENSASYKIKTKYIRSVFHAKLDAGTEFHIRRMEVDVTKLAGVGGASQGTAAGRVKSTMQHSAHLWGRSTHPPHRWGAVKSSHPHRADQDVQAFVFGEQASARSWDLNRPVFAWLDPEVVASPESLVAKETSIKLWAPALAMGHEQRVNSMLTLDTGS